MNTPTSNLFDVFSSPTNSTGRALRYLRSVGIWEGSRGGPFCRPLPSLKLRMVA